MRRYIFNKYSYILNKEHRVVLDFCSLIVFYILCFCGYAFLPIIGLNEFIERKALKSNKLFCVINEKWNNFTDYNKLYIDINFPSKGQDMSISFST